MTIQLSPQRPDRWPRRCGAARRKPRFVWMAKPGQWLPHPLAKELLTMQGDQFRHARSVDTECLAVIPEDAPLLQLVRDGLAQQPRGLTLDQVRRDGRSWYLSRECAGWPQHTDSHGRCGACDRGLPVVAAGRDTILTLWPNTLNEATGLIPEVRLRILYDFT